MDSVDEIQILILTKEVSDQQRHLLGPDCRNLTFTPSLVQRDTHYSPYPGGAKGWLSERPDCILSHHTQLTFHQG